MTQSSHNGKHEHADHGEGRSYLMFWINMALGLIVMYVVMFSMIDGFRISETISTCSTWP